MVPNTIVYIYIMSMQFSHMSLNVSSNSVHVMSHKMCVCMIFWSDIWCSTKAWTKVQSLSGWYRRHSESLPVGSELCLDGLKIIQGQCILRIQLSCSVQMVLATIFCFCNPMIYAMNERYGMMKPLEMIFLYGLMKRFGPIVISKSKQTWHKGIGYPMVSKQLLHHVPQTVPHKQQIIVQMGSNGYRCQISNNQCFEQSTVIRVYIYIRIYDSIGCQDASVHLNANIQKKIQHAAHTFRTKWN